MDALPKDGYLRLPLRLRGGRVETCDLTESVRRFIELNLNVPHQGTHRPLWTVADPDCGCAVPHHDFQALASTMGASTARLVTAIKATVTKVEPRVGRVDVSVRPISRGDAARQRPDGSFFKGVMKRVTILCSRTDGERQQLHYDVAFGGTGPVFGDDD